MFHLIKILNGRIGVPEPERITLTTATSARYGTLAILKDGALTPFTATSSALPTHLILKDSTGNEVLAASITPDMLFEVKVSAAPTAMTVGTEYLLSADGTAVSATAVSGGKRGAQLVDKMGARAAGDSLCVAFR
ncbi:MAG: hypothetical protein E7609_03720 [Ruminococcaceae bacterium]|nr:hypothetical protein [Oscillospiraceae bacterium]